MPYDTTCCNYEEEDMSAAEIRQLDREIFEPLYCQCCNEVIGVYEPLVVSDNRSARVTSRAAEPTLPAGGAYSHYSCISALDAAADAA
jgi:hypothetical protein